MKLFIPVFAGLLVAFTSAAPAQSSANLLVKRAVTPDGTCGNQNSGAGNG